MSIEHDGVSTEQRRRLTASTRHGARGDPIGRCTCGTMTVFCPTGQNIVVLQVAGEVDLVCKRCAGAARARTRPRPGCWSDTAPPILGRCSWWSPR
jgi:hypothetical protein